MIPSIEELGPQFRVFAPDLPGFGKTSADHVLGIDELADVTAEWMDAEGLEQAHVFANSFGCQVAAELAIRYPTKVARLVLQGPSTDATRRTWYQQILFWLRDAPRERPSLLPVVVRDYLRSGTLRLARTFRLALERPLEARLPLVRAPTLVIRGTDDPLVTREWATQVVRALPHGSLEELSGAHALNYSQPDLLARTLIRFYTARD